MKFPYPLLCLLLTSLSATVLKAQDAPPALQAAEVSPNIHVIAGAGGNIGVFSGADGVFVIDDGMPNVIAPVASAIAAIESIGAEPIRMLFNTHWHFDHVGGNEYFAGQGAVIIAHDNVRKRMSTSQFSKLMNANTKPSPYAALPVVTFDRSVTFHLNGDTVTATHIPDAHTDGDAVLYFRDANVVHMGDIFFNGRYPVIDVSGGGSIEGLVAAVDQLLPTVDAQTQIIPGHGPLADIDDLQAYRDMLSTVVRRIQLLIKDGKTSDEIVMLRPSVNFDEQWGWKFMPPERWVTLVYDSLISDAAKAEQPGAIKEN